MFVQHSLPDQILVCVSSVVVDEIKRIIKTSEITKYAEPFAPQPSLTRF